jgi:hypothetical protein
MSPQAFEKLQVLVTGVDAPIARDVVRLIVGDGGSVVAADKDAAKLARLDRDLGLFRTPVETARIDLANQAEIRLWEASLRGFARLPHLMICCCAGGASAGRRGDPRQVASPSDIALSEHVVRECPGHIAERVLKPALFLHAQPLRQSVFNRALAVVRHPTLRGVLARGPGRGVFNPTGLIPYVRVASHVYSVRRQFDGEPARRGRLHLVPPSPKSPNRADAA